jgi:hypothetical protein
MNDLQHYVDLVDHHIQKVYSASNNKESLEFVTNLLPSFSDNYNGKSPTECISFAQYLLSNSSIEYSKLFALERIQTIVPNTNFYSSSHYKDLIKFIQHFIFTSQPSVNSSSVISSSINLLAVLFKLSYLDPNNGFLRNEIYDDLRNYLHSGILQYQVLALRVENSIIENMNSNKLFASRHPSRYRKSCVSFRDELLLKMVDNSLNLMTETIKENNGTFELIKHCLLLFREALNFDFIGTTSASESSEDTGIVIQVPFSWKYIFEESHNVQMLWDIYFSDSNDISSIALEILVNVVSIRRSLFTSSSTKFNFISLMMKNMNTVMSTNAGLYHLECFHEFSRLLCRFKTIYKLK